jgi:hypothetical protein
MSWLLVLLLFINGIYSSSITVNYGNVYNGDNFSCIVDPSQQNLMKPITIGETWTVLPDAALAISYFSSNDTFYVKCIGEDITGLCNTSKFQVFYVPPFFPNPFVAGADSSCIILYMSVFNYSNWCVTIYICNYTTPTK